MRSTEGSRDAVAVRGGYVAPCPFDECDGSGFCVDEETNTASDCRCRTYRVSRARATRLEARIPNHYRSVSLEQLEGDKLSAYQDQVSRVRRYIRDMPSNLQAGRGLWVIGDVGTGKTALAMVVSKAAIEEGRSVAIYSTSRLLIVLRDVMSDKIEHPGGLSGFLDTLCAVDLLHLDDIGDEPVSDWAREQLYVIIDARYQEKRSLVLTTNCGLDEFREKIGAKTVSRVVETCDEPIPLFGGNQRLDDVEPPTELVKQTSQETPHAGDVRWTLGP